MPPGEYYAKPTWEQAFIRQSMYVELEARKKRADEQKKKQEENKRNRAGRR